MIKVSASALLLTYNQETLVSEALISLLEQDFENLEIIISDDKSTDKTWNVIQSIVSNYRGPKKIITNRNENNLGIVANYFKAFQLACGEVLFTCAGDDSYLPSRCSDCISLWLATEKKNDLIACDAFDMTDSGQIIKIKHSARLEKWNFEKWVKHRPYIFGAGHMVTRRLLDVGPIDPNLPYEDQCILFRALLMGGAVTIPKPLLNHRRGGISQQGSKHGYRIKKLKLINSAQHSYIEANQMLSDALILGCSEEILYALEIQKETAIFIQLMLQAETFLQKTKLFLLTKNIPWHKKFRYFQFSTLSFFHRPMMRLGSFY